jgi:hypothetical protein
MYVGTFCLEPVKAKELVDLGNSLPAESTPKRYPEWQLTNLSFDSLAQEYNRHYFLVGAPTNRITAIVGYNSSKTSSFADRFEESAKTRRNLGVHCFGPFEFEYTTDELSVKRFRIAYLDKTGVNRYTDWEDKELRSDQRSHLTSSEYSNLFRRSDPLLSRLNPFSAESWKAARYRNMMVCSLVRSYPLIGMSRAEIKGLLGTSSTELRRAQAEKAHSRYLPIHTVEEQKTDSLTEDTEDYQLYFPGCGNSGVDRLEFSYRNDRVVGYRVIRVGGGFGNIGMAPS